MMVKFGDLLIDPLTRFEMVDLNLNWTQQVINADDDDLIFTHEERFISKRSFFKTTNVSCMVSKV